ncbi:MAG: J domain-containing protein [Cyanobacteriota bacterium]|nr:J domain-containing protein [Cyanobacteriota bacterium]
MSDFNRYYEILELEPGASLKEVKEAYRDMAFVWHPDRFSQNPRLRAKAQVRLVEINEAYRQLRSLLKNNPQGLPAPPTPTAKTAPPPAPPPPSSYRSDRSWVGQPHRKATPPPSPTKKYIPWGWSIGTFLCYGGTGWVLVVADVPYWTWALVEGVACLGLTVLSIDGGGSQRSWAIALLVGGGVAGWIAGDAVGGVPTAVAWAVVGSLLGAIAAFEPRIRIMTVVVTVAGAIAMVGFIAGFGTTNIVRVILGSIIWAAAGYVFGTIVDALVASKTPNGVGSIMGFWLGGWWGAWSGAWSAAQSNNIAVAMANSGPALIVGAWGAIALVSAVVAQMVAGERLIELCNGFITFIILAAISGLGLWFGGWLANSIL